MLTKFYHTPTCKKVQLYRSYRFPLLPAITLSQATPLPDVILSLLTSVHCQHSSPVFGGCFLFRFTIGCTIYWAPNHRELSRNPQTCYTPSTWPVCLFHRLTFLFWAAAPPSEPCVPGLFLARVPRHLELLILHLPRHPGSSGVC